MTRNLALTLLASLFSACVTSPAAVPEDATAPGIEAVAGDGSRNEDWYGWGREVLAPIGGEVVRVHENPKVNEPGTMVPGIASFVLLRDDDGTHVMLGHLHEMMVQEGDRVQAGEPLGLVGNDGYSRHPHIHLGAWRDGAPLQIRFDLRAMAKLREKAHD